MEFNEVYSNYKDFVYGVVRKILKREKEEIKDLCQEIWILIFRKLHQFAHVFRFIRSQNTV